MSWPAERVTGPEFWRGLARAGSELVVLAGSRHISPVEVPDDVTREVRRFLRSVEQWA